MWVNLCYKLFKYFLFYLQGFSRCNIIIKKCDIRFLCRDIEQNQIIKKIFLNFRWVIKIYIFILYINHQLFNVRFAKYAPSDKWFTDDFMVSATKIVLSGLLMGLNLSAHKKRMKNKMRFALTKINSSLFFSGMWFQSAKQLSHKNFRRVLECVSIIFLAQKIRNHLQLLFTHLYHISSKVFLVKSKL